VGLNVNNKARHKTARETELGPFAATPVFTSIILN
jgi:hypothetical protein